MLTSREKQEIVEPIQKVIDHLVSRIEALEEASSTSKTGTKPSKSGAGAAGASSKEKA